MIHQTEADAHREDPEAGGLDALDDGPRHDRRRGPREQQECGPEYAVDPCPAVFEVVRAAHVGAHDRAPCHSMRRLHQSAQDSRSVGKREVDPPSEEEERDGHQRDEHGVLHEGVHVVLVARCADLVHAEPHVNEEHQHHGEPVVEFREYDSQCSQFVVHCSFLPRLCPARDALHASSNATGPLDRHP